MLNSSTDQHACLAKPAHSFVSHTCEKPCGSAPTAVPTIDDKNQYFSKEAAFFDIFNKWTGRPELYYGFFAGLMGERRQKEKTNNKRDIIVDFGCGTGCLTPQLLGLGFKKAYGIDPSPDMLEIAYKQTAHELTKTKKVEFLLSAPDDLLGMCKMVTAIHVHYHFETYRSLRDDFFGKMASLLSDDGSIILIGSPENSIWQAQDNTQASLHIDQIPEKLKRNVPTLSSLADGDGYVPLCELPRFEVKEGSRLKIAFSLSSPLPKQRIEVYDTFWRDLTLTKAAKAAGLSVERRQSLEWRGHKDTYRVTVYKKTANSSTLG